MQFAIPKRDFVKAFRLKDSTQYDLFNKKLDKELAEKLHPAAIVDHLTITSTWKDAGGNIHAALEGEASGFGATNGLGGELVWLKNLNKFRGTIWSARDIPSDRQLLAKARESYRQTEYHKARIYLDGIQHSEHLPRSAIFLRRLIDTKLEI